jgi:hypothetical protein
MATGRVPTTANSPLTAKGDLFTYSTAPARLAVGNNGETIVADSSTSTGLRYTAGTVQSNPVLNSAFQVWQRGTTVSGAGGGAYTADRWFLYAGSNGTVSRQATGDTTNLPNIQYCARVGRLNGVADATAFPFSQSFESVNSIPFAGKTITYSFYARRGANYSPTSNLLNYYVTTGTGTDQNVSIGGFTGGSNIIGVNATLTTTWQRFTATATVPTNTTQIGLTFQYVPVGTAGAADYFEVTGTQIDIGSVALPFRTYAGTIQGELAACQRYYETNYPQGTNPGSNIGAVNPFDYNMSPVAVPVTGTAGSSRGRTTPMTYSVNKRVVPTIRLWDGAGNLSKYTASDVNGGYLSNNNSFDTYGGYANTNNKSMAWQTVAASSAHIYCSVFWEASAEL